jgi:hypothetical protein
MPNPSSPRERLWNGQAATDLASGAASGGDQRGESVMRRMLVRYKTKPEQADENERLIRDVFAELQAKTPEGTRYLALRLGEGTFWHFVESEEGASPLTALETFRSFQSGIKERCAEAPQAGEATIVGNYRMFRA